MADICPRPPGRPFTEWISSLILRNRQFRATGDAERRARQAKAIEAGIQALLDAGTTCIGDISLTGLSIAPLLDSGLAGIVYIEVLGLDQEQMKAHFQKARSLLDKYRPQERNGLRIGLSPHAPYSLNADVLPEVIAYCRQEDVPVCIHVAESPHENEALVQGTGPFIDLHRRIGAIPPPAPGLTSIRYLESLGVLDLKPLLVHMIHVTDEELETVARSGAKVAHCPRSNQLLQCGRMPLEKMLARGIAVALGTDSLGSSPSLDVREEAKTAISLHKAFVDAADIATLLTNTAVLS
jgi:cytosine/adenosine deaminase-related metal-dependent hydrolase